MRSVREVRAATRTESIMVDSEPLLERSEQLAALQSDWTRSPPPGAAGWF
jgi:tetrahydromethanopterin S-methyltransferase subunit B